MNGLLHQRFYETCLVFLARTQVFSYSSRFRSAAGNGIYLYVVPTTNPSDLFRRAKRYPHDNLRFRSFSTNRLSHRVRRSVTCKHSVFSTTLNFSFPHLVRSRESTQQRGPVSRPLAFHTFRLFVDHSYVWEEENGLLMEVPCGPWFCFEGVVRRQPTFHNYAKHDLDRHLRGRYAEDNKGGFIYIHHRACPFAWLRLFVFMLRI